MVDDALQIAARQLITHAQSFDSFEGLVAWVVKVAWNALQMQWRRDARALPSEVYPNADADDPAEVVERRTDLAVTIAALHALSDAEREAIVSGLVEEPRHDGPEEARLKMRRYRARRHLANILSRGADGAQVSSPRPIGG